MLSSCIHLIRWVRFRVVVLVLLLMPIGASASGLFGNFNQIYGTPMPSIRSVTGRAADTTDAIDTGMLLTWRNIDENTYVTFSRYLSGWGCTIDNVQVVGDVMSCTIVGQNCIVIMEYDHSDGIISILYPEGTREEDQAIVNTSDSDALPHLDELFAVYIPDLSAAGGLALSQQTDCIGSTIISYNNVSLDMYSKLSTALGGTGCILTDFSVQRSTLTATVTLGNSTLTVVYNYNTQMMQLIYSPSVVIVSDASAITAGEYILPHLETLWAQSVPDISNVMMRVADITEVTDPYITQTWINFSAADYASLNQYLLDTGCTLVDYSLGENYVIFNMSKNSELFVIIYDRANKAVIQRTNSTTAMERTIFIDAP